MHTTTIDSVINQAEALNSEDQLLFIELFRKRFYERKREEIVSNGEATMRAIKEKKAKIGTVSDFLQDIEND